MAADPPSFRSPEDAVRRIDELLRTEEWGELAGHYDLRGSETTREELARWEWFLHGGRPMADPRGRSGPHHPFPPGSSYVGHEVIGKVARVRVAALEPGPETGFEDSPGRRTFFLVRAGGGWRLLAPDDSRIPG